MVFGPWMALGPLISNSLEKLRFTRPILMEIRPILTQMVSQNRFSDSSESGKNLQKRSFYFLEIQNFIFSAFFIGSYPPKVDEMSMKSRTLIAVEEKYNRF